MLQLWLLQLETYEELDDGGADNDPEAPNQGVSNEASKQGEHVRSALVCGHQVCRVRRGEM